MNSIIVFKVKDFSITCLVVISFITLVVEDSISTVVVRREAEKLAN